MIIGSFGPIVFRVSREKVMTISSLSLQSETRWSEHDRHLQTPLPEYLGVSNDKITLPIYLSAYLGIDPQIQIDRLRDLEKSGSPHYLVLGNKSFGRERFVITKSKVDIKRFDNRGRALEANISLTLLAYPRR